MADLRGAIVNWLIRVVLNQLLPYLGAVAVVGAGVLQNVPIAYVIATAFVTFGAASWGLNNYANWRMRLREDQSLSLSGFNYLVGAVPDHGNKLGMRAECLAKNHSNKRVQYKITEYSLFIRLDDGSGRIDCLDFKNSKDGIVDPNSEDRILFPILIIETVKDAPTLKGELTIELSYGGLLAPRYKVRRALKIFISKNEHGNHTIESVNK